MGTDEFNAGGNHAMVLHPIQGGVEILLHGTETGISSGLMSHLAHTQTLPFTFYLLPFTFYPSLAAQEGPISVSLQCMQGVLLGASEQLIVQQPF